MTIALAQRTAIPAYVAPPGAPPGGAPLLDVPYVQQTETNWCWAACCEMLLCQNGQAGHPQCQIASDHSGLICCPSPHAPTGCDIGGWPDQIYPSYGLAAARGAPLDSAALSARLAAGKPVQVCYQWSSNGMKHVALIVGSYGGDEYEVFDPLAMFGPGRRAFSAISTAYGLGEWLYTFTY